jgi:hypothetical protein
MNPPLNWVDRCGRHGPNTVVVSPASSGYRFRSPQAEGSYIMRAWSVFRWAIETVITPSPVYDGQDLEGSVSPVP